MNDELKAANEELKKANKQIEEIKKKLANKDANNKLHMERMEKLEQENIRLKDENAKVKEEGGNLKIELKQTKIKLEEVRDGTVNLVESNAQAVLINTRRALRFRNF